MNIEQIAIRFTDRTHRALGDVPIDHPYRQRWWLPIIGPTSTCLLNHLAAQASNDDWHLTPARTLATAIGLGKGTGKHSPLIRSLDRLTRFGFGHFDIEPSEQSDPCITLYRTIGLPSPRLTRSWPDDLQQAHALELAEMYPKPAEPTGAAPQGAAPPSRSDTGFPLPRGQESRLPLAEEPRNQVGLKHGQVGLGAVP